MSNPIINCQIKESTKLKLFISRGVKYKYVVVLHYNPQTAFLRSKHSSCVLTKISMYFLCHSFTCTQGCNPVKENTDAKIKVDCQINTLCQNFVWYIEDPGDDNWPVNLLNKFSVVKCCNKKKKKNCLPLT